VVQLEQVTSHFEGSRLSGDVQELSLRSGFSIRSGSGLSFRPTAWCEGVLQLLELRHRCRILLSRRGTLIQAVGVRAAGHCKTGGNLTCLLRRGLRLVQRLRRLDLILTRACDRKLRGSLRRIGRADRGILL
jgi:hypothetical protein